MTNKRGQAAVEYAILVGFVMVLLIPLIYLFYSQSSDTSVQVNSQQLRLVGQKIVDNSESVFYLGEPSKLSFKIYIPENIKQVDVTGHSIIFTTSAGPGESEIVIPSNVNLSGTLPRATGSYTITVESKGDYVAINST
jgi:uncharacterized protein (UPF0333 family)